MPEPARTDRVAFVNTLQKNDVNMVAKITGTVAVVAESAPEVNKDVEY